MMDVIEKNLVIDQSDRIIDRKILFQKEKNFCSIINFIFMDFVDKFILLIIEKLLVYSILCQFCVNKTLTTAL